MCCFNQGAGHLQSALCCVTAAQSDAQKKTKTQKGTQEKKKMEPLDFLAMSLEDPVCVKLREGRSIQGILYVWKEKFDFFLRFLEKILIY